MAGSMVSQKSPQVRLAAIASEWVRLISSPPKYPPDSKPHFHLQNVLSATALSWPELFTAVNPSVQSVRGEFLMTHQPQPFLDSSLVGG